MFSARAKVVLYLLQLLAFKVSYSVLGLESVHVKVPIAVLVGSSVTLVCECDLPDEDLYSVKWYKGKHEFFRYTSKEIPSIKIFPKAGINVGVKLSNVSHLVLASVEPQSSGKYSCEITEAAPSFHTKIATRTMNVIDPPTTDPQIVDMKPYYGADEFLEVACTTSPSLPAAKLEWRINDQPLLQPLVGPSRLEFLTLPAATDGSASQPGKGKPSSKKTQLDKSSQQQQEQLQQEPQRAPVEAASEPSLNRYNELSTFGQTPAAATPGSSSGGVNSFARSGSNAPTVPHRLSENSSNTTTITTTATSTGSASGPGSEHRKPAGNGRYELAVSRLKLLLDHGHFPNGKLKVECIAHIYDLYTRSVVAFADENYPQVRVLSNSDNGVHFSFMSDKDDAPSSASGRLIPPTLTDLLGKTSYFISLIGTWLTRLCGSWFAPNSLALIADTGQRAEQSAKLPEPTHASNRDPDTAFGCIVLNILLAGLGSFAAQRAVAGGS
uniref:Ig-like domain-containing protein n=1 Tax=Anopheles atroparvus TaxID=41427 RepID=A0A182JCZ6_ANOAO